MKYITEFNVVKLFFNKLTETCNLLLFSTVWQHYWYVMYVKYIDTLEFIIYRHLHM